MSNLGLQWIINRFYFEREVFRVEYAFLTLQVVLLACASRSEGFRLPQMLYIVPLVISTALNFVQFLVLGSIWFNFTFLYAIGFVLYYYYRISYGELNLNYTWTSGCYVASYATMTTAKGNFCAVFYPREKMLRDTFYLRNAKN